MSFRTTAAAASVFLVILAGCGNHPASDSVKAFTLALADSSWSSAWALLTPETQAAWDSTAVVMQQFGYTECSEFLQTLSVPVTEEEFSGLTGELLFTRMVQSSDQAARLSDAVREVETVDSLTVLVRVATSEGDQIIPARLHQERWLLDLTSLTPPPQQAVE